MSGPLPACALSKGLTLDSTSGDISMAKATAPRNRAAGSLTVSRSQLLNRGGDQAFRQFVHDTLAFSGRIQAIRNALGSVIGLSGTQYTILIAIARDQHTKGIGINHVAEVLHFSPAFVTIEVNKLVAAKLITKKTHSGDRRRVVLSTTSKAEELLRSLTLVQRPVNDMLFEGLTAEDFDRLRHKMPELVESAGRALRLFDLLVKSGANSAPVRTGRKAKA
jgi:DNA-binding MarR family transcriptional regulator